MGCPGPGNHKKSAGERPKVNHLSLNDMEYIVVNYIKFWGTLRDLKY